MESFYPRNEYDRRYDRDSGRGQSRGRSGRGRKKKSRASRTLLFTVILGGGFTVVLLVYLMFFRDRERTVPMTETPITPAMTHLNTGRGLLYQTEGQIHYYDWIDQKKNYTYGMGSSDIRMSGSQILSAVYTNDSLQIVGQDRPISFTGTIETVECGTTHYAVLRKNSEGSESILIMTEDGDQLDQILPGEAAYIVNFGFYQIGSSERFWVQMLATSASEPVTTIRTYDLNLKSQTGAIQIQSQLVADMYITQNSFFIGGTNQILRYTHDGNKESYRVMVYGYRILDFSTSSSSPMFLLTPRGGDMHSVKLLTVSDSDDSLTKETYLQLPSEGVAGFLMNGSLVVVSEDKMFTYTTSGRLSETAALQYPIKNAYKLSDTVLLLESEGKYYTCRVD